MAKQQPLFVPASFFMVRTPLLPIDYFQRMDQLNEPTEFIKNFYSENECFQEAVAIASPSLKEEIDKNRNSKETIDSLLKYFSRMTSRSTPFGLFSFVSYGVVDGEINAQIDLNHVIKRARPDMEWLQNVIEKICQDESFFLQLPVQHNPLLTMQGDRFCVGYLIKKLDQKSISIRNSLLTKTIFSLTKDSIKVEELIQKVLTELPNLIADKVQGVIKTLIEQQFLWFSLLPSLMSSSPYKEFLKNVPKSYLEPLSSINLEIENYSNSPLGKGLDLLPEVNKRMKDFVESKSYLQVDAAAPKIQIMLPQHVLEEVAEGAEVLWRLPEEASSEISAYADKFMAKYGANRLVPLYELLDETRGLGLPDFDKNSQKEEVALNAEGIKFKQWQRESLAGCLWEHKQEIEITDEVLKKWSEKPVFNKAAPSTDVFFEIYADSVEEVNQGNYLVMLSGLTYQGGATFGRFLDMFGEDLHDRINQYYRSEEKLDSQSIFVESSYLPPTSRSQNVSINPNFRKLLIDLSPGGTASLSLDDIYVGIKNECLFLTSKDGNEEYYVTATNVLNNAQAPVPLRFLRDISRSKYQMCKNWSWGNLSNMPFLPRVKYKRLILSPAKWNVSLEKIGGLTKDSLQTIVEKFQKWADQFQMVRYVFITEADNKLLIDRMNSNHLEILARQLKKTSLLQLTEKMGQEKGEWLTSQYGKHSCEFILPLLKNIHYAKVPDVLMKRFAEHIPAQVRWRLPGSEWLFAKFYLPKDSEKRFLSNHLKPFIDYLHNQNLINQWFFIRYKDERPHLRIRFQGNAETLNKQLLPILHDWSLKLIQDGLIQDLSLASYEREIERYGGIELMPLIENLFCADSVAVLELLRIEKEINMPFHVVGALCTLDLLRGLHFDASKQKIFFEQTGINKSELSGFKEWRKTFFASPPAPISSILEARLPSLTLLAKKMEELETLNLLTANPYSIASSIIHMHCNRLMGTDIKAEMKIRAFAGYALQNPLPIPQDAPIVLK